MKKNNKGIAKLSDIEDVPDSLISRMKKKFPNGRYNIVINLWDDHTYMVSLNHGERPKGGIFILHIWQYRKGKFSYKTEKYQGGLYGRHENIN